MAATGIGNPAGAVQVSSWEPKVWTAGARSNISGGVFVYASGAAGVVSSGTNSFVARDVLVTIDASGALFNGIALQSTASGGLVPVATEGVFILAANGTVTAGYPVSCDGSNAVANAGSVAGNLAALRTIGRALTEATSGGYCLVHVRA